MPGLHHIEFHVDSCRHCPGRFQACHGCPGNAFAERDRTALHGIKGPDDAVFDGLYGKGTHGTIPRLSLGPGEGFVEMVQA